MRHLFAITAAVLLIGMFTDNASAQFKPRIGKPNTTIATQPNTRIAGQPNTPQSPAATPVQPNATPAQPNTRTVPGAAARTVNPANPTYYRRPWSYGNAPYYNRPPTQYYPVPYPTYRPYYPYDAVDQGYGYYVAPWGGQPYYVPPRYYYNQPYYNQPYYNQPNPYYRYR